MAKDVVDFMYETVLEFFGWLFSKLAKWAWVVITALVLGIFKLLIWGVPKLAKWIKTKIQAGKETGKKEICESVADNRTEE